MDHLMAVHAHENEVVERGLCLAGEVERHRVVDVDKAVA